MNSWRKYLGYGVPVEVEEKKPECRLKSLRIRRDKCIMEQLELEDLMRAQTNRKSKTFKLYGKQRADKIREKDKIVQQLNNLEKLASQLANARDTVNYVETIKTANKEMTETMADIDVDDIKVMQDDMQNMLADVDIINDALAGSEDSEDYQDEFMRELEQEEEIVFPEIKVKRQPKREAIKY